VPPSVLLVSSEARIPWGLAVIEPALRALDSPSLCAQVNNGRCVVGPRGSLGSPPNSVKAIELRGVVVGDYAGCWSGACCQRRTTMPPAVPLAVLTTL
jgi:hypothetical protein